MWQVLCAAMAALFAWVAPAWPADKYPARPVRLVVGLAPGGGTDAIARLVAEYLQHKMGQPFIVENRPGMGGNLANQVAINSPPDGYTLLFTGPNSTISSSLYKNLPFDFARDVTPVGGVMHLPNLMTV